MFNSHQRASGRRRLSQEVVSDWRMPASSCPPVNWREKEVKTNKCKKAMQTKGSYRCSACFKTSCHFDILRTKLFIRKLAADESIPTDNGETINRNGCFYKKVGESVRPIVSLIVKCVICINQKTR